MLFDASSELAGDARDALRRRIRFRTKKEGTRGQDVMTALRAPARIVVIDDDPRVVDRLVGSFREEVYGVMGALTSATGLKLAVLSRADLILLDIEFARVNGMELLKRIRAFNPAIRVIVVTGNRDPVRAREALELGALAYVDKPFDLAYLKRVVAMALRQSM